MIAGNSHRHEPVAKESCPGGEPSGAFQTSSFSSHRTIRCRVLWHHLRNIRVRKNCKATGGRRPEDTGLAADRLTFWRGGLPLTNSLQALNCVTLARTTRTSHTRAESGHPKSSDYSRQVWCPHRAPREPRRWPDHCIRLYWPGVTPNTFLKMRPICD